MFAESALTFLLGDFVLAGSSWLLSGPCRALWPLVKVGYGGPLLLCPWAVAGRILRVCHQCCGGVYLPWIRVVSGSPCSFACISDGAVPQRAFCPVLAGRTVGVSPGGWVKAINFNSRAGGTVLGLVSRSLHKSKGLRKLPVPRYP